MAKQLNPLLRNAYTYLVSLNRIKNKEQVARDLNWPRSSNSYYLNGNKQATPEYLEKFAGHYKIVWDDFSQLKAPVKLQAIPKEDLPDFLVTKITDLEKAVAFLISLQLGNDPEKIQAAKDLLGPSFWSTFDGNEQG